MENKQMYLAPFLPRLLYLMSLMVLAFTELHLMIHAYVFALFWLYERFILPKNPFRRHFFSQIGRYLPFLLFLFFFYAVFLQLGHTALFTFTILHFEWVLYQESLMYALHYILLFLEFFWVVHLIYFEKKIDQIQYFFYGNLFSLTLIWNGSIQQAKQLFQLKQTYDEVLVARGVVLSKMQSVVRLFEYVIEHMMTKVYRQIPIYQRMWKNKMFYMERWPERVIWMVPLLFILTALVRQEFSVDFYLKIQTLIAVVGVALFYLVIRFQYEEMSPQQKWHVGDRLVVLLLLGWLVYRFYQVEVFYTPTFIEFVSIRWWPYEKFVSVLGLGFLMISFGGRHD